jgi:hypothetical protein
MGDDEFKGAPEEYKGAAEDGYRAIGRWVVEFSRLIGGMRANLENHLRKPDENPEVVGVVFGDAAARQISDAFFAICRLLGELDDPEENIAKQLQKEVGEEITMRNKIAHGDWIIGKGIEEQTAQTYLVRVFAKAPHRRVECLTSRDLDDRSDRLYALRRMVYIFGELALRLPILTVNGLSHPGAYRISDVLIAENVPRSGKGGQVVMAGPRASELL